MAILDLYNKQEYKCVLSGEKPTMIANLINGEINDYNLSIDRKDSSNSYNIDNIQLVGEINDYNLSIDSEDSSKDYTIDNIQLVGAIINIMKNDIDENDFLLFVSTIAIISMLDERDKAYKK